MTDSASKIENNELLKKGWLKQPVVLEVQTFAALLNALLSERGLTQAQFAKRVGVSRSLAHRWLNDDRLPGKFKQYHVANVLNVSFSLIRDSCHHTQLAREIEKLDFCETDEEYMDENGIKYKGDTPLWKIEDGWIYLWSTENKEWRCTVQSDLLHRFAYKDC